MIISELIMIKPRFRFFGIWRQNQLLLLVDKYTKFRIGPKIYLIYNFTMSSYITKILSKNLLNLSLAALTLSIM